MSVNRILCLTLVMFMVILSGCEEESGGTSAGTSNLEFSATPLEGFAPLKVSFSTDRQAGGLIWDFGDNSAMSQDVRRIDHTFEQPGVYTVSLSVTDTSGDISSTTKKITVHARSNLVVTNFAISSTGSAYPTLQVTPLALNTVSATIQNIGSGPITGLGELHVGYYLSRDQNITVDDIYIGDTTIVLGSNDLSPGQFGIPELGPQEEYNFVHQLALKGNIPNGTYYAGAIVDYIDYYTWYDFPSATDTLEYTFPTHMTVSETNERDNTSATQQVTVTTSTPCTQDAYEGDNSAATATVLALATPQSHNLCFDNSDWFQFTAVAGNTYKISVEVADGVNGEIDPQLILFDQNARDILLFQDNIDNFATVDLEAGWCTGDVTPGEHFCANASIVWKATTNGTYYLKVRTAACDEDQDDYCRDIVTNENTSPDGVGNNTGYTITLQ